MSNCHLILLCWKLNGNIYVEKNKMFVTSPLLKSLTFLNLLVPHSHHCHPSHPSHTLNTYFLTHMKKAGALLKISSKLSLVGGFYYFVVSSSGRIIDKL